MLKGKPNLDARFEGLNISCLDEHQKQLEEMLEPLDLSDVLFEVGALDFLEHDRITEDECRKNQVIHLLNVLTEDKNDCFYWFQWCLKEENNNSIIELLRSASESLLTEPGMLCMKTTFYYILKQKITRYMKFYLFPISRIQ